MVSMLEINWSCFVGQFCTFMASWRGRNLRWNQSNSRFGTLARNFKRLYWTRVDLRKGYFSSDSRNCKTTRCKNLIHGLLWTTKCAHQAKRPQAWRATSWSWASVVGEVTWEHITIEKSVSVLSCSRSPVWDDTFRELVSGFIRLRGQFMRAILVPQPHGVNSSFQLHVKRAYKLHANTMDCYLDGDMPAPKPSK